MHSAREEELGWAPWSPQAAKCWHALTQTIVQPGWCCALNTPRACPSLWLCSFSDFPSRLAFCPLFSSSIGHATNISWTCFVVQHQARYSGSRKIKLIWPRLSRSLFPGKGDGAYAQVILVANIQGEWDVCLLEWLGEYGERSNTLWPEDWGRLHRGGGIW